MTTRSEMFVTGVSVPPGLTLKEMFIDKGFNQKSFAKAIGMQPSHLSELINGKRKINPQVADSIVEVLGGKSSFWLKLQAQYDYNKIALQDRDIEEAKTSVELDSYNELIDLTTLIKRTCTDVLYTAIEKLDFIKSTLCVQSPAELQNVVNGLFRKSTKTGLDERMLMTWIVLAKIQAKKEMPEFKFSLDSVNSLPYELSAILHENINTLERVKSLLNSYGIGFSVVEKVEKASVDGYSYWEGDTPVIVVSKRFNRIDNLAFTIMHELCHIYKHDKNPRLSIEGYEFEAKELDDEADEFARECLIPAKVWSTLPQVKLSPFMIQKVCTSWSNSNNLNKWIALGRVSNETGMYKFRVDRSRNIN